MIVRYGYPARDGIQWLEPKSSEDSISPAEFAQLLEPLKHLQVPPYSADEAVVLDGAIIGFEVVLGSTRFSYQWHTIPPKGWEPIADWLGGALRKLERLTSTPTYEY